MAAADAQLGYLRSLLDYDPAMGVFTWRVERGLGGRGAQIGAVAGTLVSTGYTSIKIDGRRYQAHRLAWLFSFGAWPRGDVDHINGRRDDNRIANLREATRTQNCANRRRNRNNTTGVSGVTLRRGRYDVRLGSARERHWLGSFSTLDEARRAYGAASLQQNGEFAREVGVLSGT